MNSQPIIVKLGSTLPSLAAQLGDFEDWVLRGMGLAHSDIRIIDPTQGDNLPSPEAISGAVITGSHAMVTDHEPWSERTALWLRAAVRARTPVLGICYGHQLLAYALGGEVGDNPAGKEFGTVDAHLTPPAASDRLLGALESPIKVHTSHTQTVLHLPDGARLLATSAMDRNLAFAFGDSAWGVQFHPEFSAYVVRAYIQAFRSVLISEGRDPAELLGTCVEAPYGSIILRRFAKLVTEPLQLSA